NILVTGGSAGVSATAYLGNAALAAAGSAPLISTGASEQAIFVDAGATLELNAALIGSTNFNKGLGGTLRINTTQYFANSTSRIALSGGTVVLNAGTNSIFPGVQGGANSQYLVVSPGATLDLNGNSQMVGLLKSPNTDTYQGTGGLITSATPATLVQSTQNTASWGGVIAGSISFNAAGSTGATFYSANTYTGSTLVNYGGLTLKDAGQLTATSAIELNYATLTIDNGGLAALSNRVNDAATITMRGGHINLTGRDNTEVSETFGNLTLAEGMNSLNASNASTGLRSTELVFGSLTVSNDATLASWNSTGLIGSTGRIKFTNGASLLVNGILPFANMQTDLAAYDPQFGLGALGNVGFRGYDYVSSFAFPSSPTSIQNVKLQNNTLTAPSLGGGTYAMNALVFGVNAGGQSLLFGGSSDTLNLTAGAFTITGSSGLPRT
ncbi:MAG: hypothetical protein EBS01_15365, partial [Verrucomicrobia bacterium]|nr:hypothetical protein [Verrucomicrobiota bacterium]